jgi:hypothetical protein
VVEEVLRGTVEPKQNLQMPARVGGYPVAVQCGRCGWTEQEVHAAVGVSAELLAVRGSARLATSRISACVWRSYAVADQYWVTGTPGGTWKRYCDAPSSGSSLRSTMVIR